jgi:hypothetical protein
LRITVFLLSTLLCASGFAASSEYERRYLELREHYESAAESEQLELLESFFGISPPEIGERPVDRRFYVGISDSGYADIVSARRDETARMVEELNCGKLSVAKLCQILVDQPDASAEFIAEQKAADRERRLKRKLGRYKAVFDRLSPEDQSAVQEFNMIAFGQAMPAVPDAYRELLVKLAEEFPDEFRESQTTDCLIERRDDAQLLLLPEEASAWRDLGPVERCEKTKQHARTLMLVCPENFDPQDEDKPCEELLSPENAILAQ